MVIAALSVCRWKGSLLSTLAVWIKYIYLVLPLLAVMTLAHAHELKKMSLSSYIGKILGYPGKERIVYLDFTRALAVAFIILTHACSSQLSADAEPWKISLLTCISSATLVSNPLYFMLSGALLLSSTKKESVGHFYYTRFVKVVVPFVIVYFLFMIIFGVVNIHDMGSICDGIRQVLAGAHAHVPHFWFMYVLFGLYLSAPFLKVMVQNMSDKEIQALFCVILAEEVLTVFLPLMGISLGVGLDLGNYAGVFLLGYIITGRSSRARDTFLMITGSLCGIYTALILLIKDYASVSPYLYNCSPIAVLFSCAIIVALKKNEQRLRRRPHKIITAISTNGYLMMLLHWSVLFYITRDTFGVQPLLFGCIGGIALSLILTLAVCYILSAILENTIMISAKYLLSLPMDTLSSIRQKKQA